METQKGQIKAPGSRTDADILEVIEDRLGRGRTPRQISGEMEADPRFKGRVVPSIKTISRMAKVRRPPDPEERWSLIDAAPEEVPVVLALFAAMARHDKAWRWEYVTKENAHVLVRIQAAAPDLDPWVAYSLAERYLSHRARGLPTFGLDLGLAFSLWRGESWAAEFRRVVDAGWLGDDLRWNARLPEVDKEPADWFGNVIGRDIDAWIDVAGVYWAGLTDEERDASSGHRPREPDADLE